MKWEEVVELDNRWAAYQHLERSYLYIESECCAFAITSTKQPLIQLYESGRGSKCYRLSDLCFKWGASSRWSFDPNSAWGCIETTTIEMTHPTLVLVITFRTLFWNTPKRNSLCAWEVIKPKVIFMSGKIYLKKKLLFNPILVKMMLLQKLEVWLIGFWSQQSVKNQHIGLSRKISPNCLTFNHVIYRGWHIRQLGKSV